MNMPRKSRYHAIIQEILTKLNLTHIKPEWVEASMRLEYGTLSDISKETFEVECKLTDHMIKIEGEEWAIQNAASFGM